MTQTPSLITGPLDVPFTMSYYFSVREQNWLEQRDYGEVRQEQITTASGLVDVSKARRPKNFVKALDRW